MGKRKVELCFTAARLMGLFCYSENSEQLHKCSNSECYARDGTGASCHYFPFVECFRIPSYLKCVTALGSKMFGYILTSDISSPCSKIATCPTEQ